MTKKLLGLAESLIAGSNYKWRVIPLYGDSDSSRPKLSTIEWGEYQQRPLHLPALAKLIEDTGAAALGVLTGKPSANLIVVDLDTEERLNEFKAAFSGLYNRTMRVNTKRGKHVYVILPHYFDMPNLKIKGADLQSTGRYVVSQNSIINGHKYTREGATFPAKASKQEASDIQSWFKARQVKEVSSLPSAPATPATQKTTNLIKNFDEAQSYYFYQIDVTGSRNEALFQTALKCRDSGQMQQWTAAALIDSHITAAPVTDHRNESDESREKEAVATIASAYSRGARNHETIEPVGLPNAVREALAHERQQELDYGNQSANPRHQTSASIVLDALRNKGVRPGETFSFTSARRLLLGEVSTWVIWQGIQYMRERAYIKISSPRTPVLHQSKSIDCSEKTAKSLIGHFQKEIKANRGRHETLYIMPSNLELCAKLRLKYSRISDEISIEDCRKPNVYRSVLHAKFIDRRPGTHSKTFLSNRVGVCIRTVQRYDDTQGISSEYQHTSKLVTWSSVGNLPDESIPGHFLQIDGKNFPPIAAIAMRALKNKQEVLYCQRTQAMYWRSVKPIRLQEATAAPLPIQRPQSRVFDELPVIANEDVAGGHERVEAVQLELPAMPAPDVVQAKPRRNRKTDRAYENQGKRFRKPLTNPTLETLAHTAFNTVNDLEGCEMLSMAMARRIAFYCEPKRVKQALKLVSLDRIESPVRFFVSVSGYASIIRQQKELAKIELGKQIRGEV
jgi:hypothetical protein